MQLRPDTQSRLHETGARNQSPLCTKFADLAMDRFAIEIRMRVAPDCCYREPITRPMTSHRCEADTRAQESLLITRVDKIDVPPLKSAPMNRILSHIAPLRHEKSTILAKTTDWLVGPFGQAALLPCLHRRGSVRGRQRRRRSEHYLAMESLELETAADESIAPRP